MELTTILAIYAATLSTAVFFWNVSRTKAKILVKLIFSVEDLGEKYVHGVSIAVQNPSSYTVHLTNISLLYPYLRPRLKDYIVHMFRFKRWPSRIGWCNTSLSNYGIDDGCPLALEPGNSHRVLIPEDKLEHVLADATDRQLVAVVQDALWRNKYSTIFQYSTSARKEPLEIADDEAILFDKKKTPSQNTSL